MPEPTPQRAGREPPKGTLYPSQVLASNLRDYRLMRRLEQATLAERMLRLGHQWAQQTVSEAERGRRNVTVDELLALCLALNVTIDQLLDPRGPLRRNGPDLALTAGGPPRSDEQARTPAAGPYWSSTELHRRVIHTRDDDGIVIPAAEVGALVCAHETLKHPIWDGPRIEAVMLEDAERQP